MRFKKKDSIYKEFALQKWVNNNDKEQMISVHQFFHLIKRNVLNEDIFDTILTHLLNGLSSYLYLLQPDKINPLIEHVRSSFLEFYTQHLDNQQI